MANNQDFNNELWNCAIDREEVRKKEDEIINNQIKQECKQPETNDTKKKKKKKNKKQVQHIGKDDEDYGEEYQEYDKLEDKYS